jgi:Fur family transcriptional regulator, ferric uptake regulator
MVAILENQTLTTALRRKGLRITPQREMILLALTRNQGQMTAEQILEKVHEYSPCVNIATVYRNLDILRDNEILSVTALPDHPLQWELVDIEPHHHLVCTRCGHIEQVPHEVVEVLAAKLRREYGFHADLKHMTLPGVCAHCAKKADHT